MSSHLEHNFAFCEYSKGARIRIVVCINTVLHTLTLPTSPVELPSGQVCLSVRAAPAQTWQATLTSTAATKASARAGTQTAATAPAASARAGTQTAATVRDNRSGQSWPPRTRARNGRMSMKYLQQTTVTT